MKFNWGTGIVLAFIGFIGFILYFVIIASTSEKANHDLVTDEYYQEELVYQESIEAIENARSLGEKIGVRQTGSGFSLQFPTDWDLSSINGVIVMYRPSNKNLDFQIPISLVNARMDIPARRLAEGKWNLTIRWEMGGETYLQKEQLTYVRQ